VPPKRRFQNDRFWLIETSRDDSDESLTIAGWNLDGKNTVMRVTL
jgi:hypothetical protein